MITSYDTYSTAHVHTMWKEHISKSCGIFVALPCGLGFGLGVEDCALPFSSTATLLAGYGKMWYIFLAIEGQALDPPPSAA